MAKYILYRHFISKRVVITYKRLMTTGTVFILPDLTKSGNIKKKFKISKPITICLTVVG